MKTVALHHWVSGLAVCGLLGLVSPGSAEDWTRFRGPNGTGMSEVKTIPTKFTEKDYRWKVNLPGSGHSSPVHWKDKIFLTSTKEKAGGVILLCLKASDGSVIWQKDIQYPAHHLHRFNSFASSSAVVDKDQVYFTWITPSKFTVAAFTHDGKMNWERDLGPFKSQHGGGVSPMVHDGMVVVPNEQMGASSIMALDAKTGKTVWKTPRNSGKTAYGTPSVQVMPTGETALVFTSHAHGVYAVNPKTGAILWEYADAFDKRSVSSSVSVGGLLIGTCGSGGGGNYVVAIRPPDSPGKKPELVYEIRRSAPYVPTSVVVGNLLFLWSDGGIVTCVDGPTGKVKYSERVGGSFFGSPVCVDGKIYCISKSGEVVVLKAADTFQVLARNPLGELSYATPTVAEGRIYLRTKNHLICVGG